MTRTLLCAGLAGLCLALGLATALLQSGNRERGLELNALKEECAMIEAVNGERTEEILRLDFGPLPFEPGPAARATTGPAPKKKAVAP